MSAATPSVLARIIRSTRAELALRKRAVTSQALAEIVEQHARSATRAPRRGVLRTALTRPGIAVIAEFKRRSPSAGVLREGAEVAQLVGAYERGGAGALSILTEQANFDGSLEDLRAAREVSRLPILRKDFVVDRYQLLEASAAGADAVLLIVAALSDSEFASLLEDARELGLDVLVEVHDRNELERALALEPELIGINNRDLRDFSVDIGRTRVLRPAIPPGVVVVSESGIGSAEQLRELERDGVDAVLIGESLMRSRDPAGALRGLLGSDGARVGTALGDIGQPAPETVERPRAR
jgi:indole-3-glycerol phosphate synthase